MIFFVFFIHITDLSCLCKQIGRFLIAKPRARFSAVCLIAVSTIACPKAAPLCIFFHFQLLPLQDSQG